MRSTMRLFKGDRWTRALGSPIPHGAQVCVVKFLPRRRAVIEYAGARHLTMLWCLKKPDNCQNTVL